MKAPLLVILLICFLSFQHISASVSLSSASGRSGFDNETVTTPTIYGGRAGSCTDTEEAEATSTCDSCENTLDSPCNPNKIVPSTILSITFTSTASTGIPRIYSSKGNIAIDTTPDVTVTKGTPVTLTTTWGQICEQLSGDSTCSKDIILLTDSTRPDYNNYLEVGIDEGDSAELEDALKVQFRIVDQTAGSVDDCSTPTVTGICGLKAYPGDNKAFITDISSPTHSASNFPILAGDFDVKAVKIFYSTTSFADITNKSTNTIFNLESDGKEISSDRIEGLNNGEVYFFKFASIDEAGNVFDLQDDEIFTNLAGCNTSIDITASDVECDYKVVPDEVIGLLTENLDCFVATATYGSSLHKNLDDLRAFRNQFLARNSLGKKFIRFYYNHGPKAAQYIYDQPWLKKVSQVMLWPVWAFSYVATQWSIWLAIGFMLSSFFIVFISIKKLSRLFITPSKAH
ncbi:MAG: hypothetical protein HOO06_15755 [Bdellovibrionaceae bacterium]|jgi:hypothetical protein|nr:hypothetical protein [Pseudobdellovibrionaceae bacterium]